MKNHYICPHCRGHLRVGENIVLKVRNTLREKGIMLLHPEVGNYTSLIHPDFSVIEGERLDFFCPLCMNYLDAAIDENLVHMIMVDGQGTEHKVYFSRVADEQSPYRVSDDGSMITGVHSYKYAHFESSDQQMSSFQY